jgi:serine/threonine protein kinase
LKIQLKIAEFSVSKATLNATIVGTMENMPPEAIKGGAKEDVGFALDLWPVGIIFQMLCVFRNC